MVSADLNKSHRCVIAWAANPVMDSCRVTIHLHNFRTEWEALVVFNTSYNLVIWQHATKDMCQNAKFKPCLLARLRKSYRSHAIVKNNAMQRSALTQFYVGARRFTYSQWAIGNSSVFWSCTEKLSFVNLATGQLTWSRVFFYAGDRHSSFYCPTVLLCHN